MIYRVGTAQDYPAIEQFVKDSGYHRDIAIEDVGGNWIIAVHDGVVHGTVWFFGERPHAYVDYWIARGKTAAMLATHLEMLFRSLGVRFVRAMTTNPVATRMLSQGMAMRYSENATFIYKDLADGLNDHADDDNSGSDGAGVPATRPADATGSAV